MSQLLSYKNIWKVSFPIILSGVAQNIVNVTDTAFLGRVGIIEIGAAGNAGILYFVLMMLGMGFTIGCQIMIGRRNGEKDYLAIGKIFSNGLYFMLGLGLMMLLTMKFLSPLLLESLTASPSVLEASNLYINIRSWGIPFAYLSFLFISFFTGITETKVLIRVTFFQAFINVILDYLLIFGHLGFPKLGIEGAALASMISEIGAFIYIFIYTIRKIDLKKYNLLINLKFDKKLLNKMLKIGSPIMAQNFIALSTWLCFFMIIEQIGERELAISHIIRSIYMVLMIPLFGFSTATSTLVSNLIGEGRSYDVLKLVKKVSIMCLGFTVTLMPLSFLFPERIISIYTNDLNLINDSIPVLFVITGAMLLFSIAYITFSAVTGTGKTQKTLAIEITSIAIYLSGAYLLGVHLDLPLYLVWCSEFIYFGFMGSLSILYLKFGNWKSATI
jgi:putative MATE family efflux protein